MRPTSYRDPAAQDPSIRSVQTQISEEPAGPRFVVILEVPLLSIRQTLDANSRSRTPESGPSLGGRASLAAAAQCVALPAPVSLPAAHVKASVASAQLRARAASVTGSTGASRCISTLITYFMAVVLHTGQRHTLGGDMVVPGLDRRSVLPQRLQT